MANKLNAPDLTQRPPRSPRVRLGGFAILPRVLDKGRATVAGTNGDYTYACPLDQRFFAFSGIDPKALRKLLAAGKGDCEVLEWIQKNLKPARTEAEIEAWSQWEERRVPAEPDKRAYFNKLHSEVCAKRKDIGTWFDLLDLDDYVSYGGQA